MYGSTGNDPVSFLSNQKDNTFYLLKEKKNDKQQYLSCKRHLKKFIKRV